MNGANKTIGKIVAEDYRTAKVFEGHGIDFCCGGNTALRTICKEKEIDIALLTQELEAAKNKPVERSQDFSSWELSFLADYIVNVHHNYLKENMDKIDEYTGKIADVHGSNHPEVVKIAVIFSKIVIHLKAHLKEEEETFFPALKRVDANKKASTKPAGKDVEIMQESLKNLVAEHEEIGDAVHDIHRLATGYTIPDDVCNTFALTYRKLKEFEEDLHKHVHLENNILFPKARQLT
jgi:regulator of cell morphogenesis and NO signaling